MDEGQIPPHHQVSPSAYPLGDFLKRLLTPGMLLHICSTVALCRCSWGGDEMGGTAKCVCTQLTKFREFFPGLGSSQQTEDPLGLRQRVTEP